VMALDAVTIVPVAPRVGPPSHLCLLPFRPALASDVVLLKRRHRTLTPTAELFAAFVREHGTKLGSGETARSSAPPRVSKLDDMPALRAGRRRRTSQGVCNGSP
jgi:hypothetical protein